MMSPMAASFIATAASSLVQPVASSLIDAISGRGVMGVGKGQECEFLPLLVLP